MTGEVRFVRVIVAEQDAKLRTALCVWVSHVPGVELSGVARNSRELLHALATSRADLAVVDWELLAGQANALLAEAGRVDPRPRIVVLSRDPEQVCDAALLQAVAVIDKALLPTALLQLLSEFDSAAALH
jgi:DNA-binding NarL/FixJ family response regulator